MPLTALYMRAVPALPAVLQMYGSGSGAAQVEQAFAGTGAGAGAAPEPGSPPSPYMVSCSAACLRLQGLPAQEGWAPARMHRWLLKNYTALLL